MGSCDDPVEVEGSGSDGNEDNESSGGDDDVAEDGTAEDAGSVGSAEEQDDDDGNGDDDEGEEQEKEEEQVCVDCGKSPCAFQAEVSNLVQFGIDREWLPQDFDTQVEMNQEKAEARGAAMVENPEDHEMIVKRQRHHCYETYHHYMLSRYGPGKVSVAS
jgi:hypothetical protein